MNAPSGWRRSVVRITPRTDAAIAAIATKIGCTAQTLSNLLRQAERLAIAPPTYHAHVARRADPRAAPARVMRDAELMRKLVRTTIRLRAILARQGKVCVMIGVISVIVVQPYPILREGLIRILSRDSGMSCLGFGSVSEIGAEGVIDITKRVIFLLDLGRDSSAETQGIVSLNERFPGCAVVVLSEQYSQCHLLNALEGGACGYLTKDIGCETLIKYLELVAQGERVFPTQALQLLYNKEFLNTYKEQTFSESRKILSGREVEVIRSLSQGKSNKYIARQWGISEATVKVHVKAILRKIHLKNRTEAALWARDHGISVEQALPSVNGAPPARPEPKSHQG